MFENVKGASESCTFREIRVQLSKRQEREHAF
jgi:hypothetical protein